MRVAAAAGLVLALARPVAAQQPAEPRTPGRALQEQRLRQRLGAIVREQLGLDDAQTRQLGQVSARFEQERRGIAQRERELRLQLRDELQGGTAANQDRVARALDRLLEVQRTRVDLLQREQQELAKFLSPVQRAKYLGLQDQVRRRLEDARREREGAAGQAPARPRRPGALRPRAP
jgi:hypothetical protein